MDQRLQERLDKWHNGIEAIAKSERLCLTLEAQEKPLWSKIFLAMEGKTVSEREARTYVNQDWLDFQNGLVEARVEYLRSKRLLELKQSAFNAEYLECKTTGDAISRMPRSLT